MRIAASGRGYEAPTGRSTATSRRRPKRKGAARARGLERLPMRDAAALGARDASPRGSFSVQIQLDAPVQGPTVLRVVRRDRITLAEAGCREARAVDALLHQVVLHRLRAALGQALVVALRAGRVRVARDVHRGARVLAQHARGLIE